jgi:hypothetical protein
MHIAWLQEAGALRFSRRKPAGASLALRCSVTRATRSMPNWHGRREPRL